MYVICCIIREEVIELGICRLHRYSLLPFSSLSSVYFIALLIRFIIFEKLKIEKKGVFENPTHDDVQGVIIDLLT